MTTTYAEGTYRAEVRDQGFGEATTGTPFFYLQLAVQARLGPQAKLTDCPIYERTYRQYLANETGARILKADLAAIGVEVDDLTRLDPAADDPVLLVGRTIDVECRVEPFNGKPTERWLIPRARKKLGLDAVRQLNARLGGALAGGPASPPTKDKPTTL